jgi:hypothetical protein
MYGKRETMESIFAKKLAKSGTAALCSAMIVMAASTARSTEARKPEPLVIFLGEAKGAGGDVTWADYRDAFYRDFFEYTRMRLGTDRVITARLGPRRCASRSYASFLPATVSS